MRPKLLVLISALIAAPSGLQAQPVYVPLPTRDELREIQLMAYACSRQNKTEDCDRTRSLSDPLMDHPRLPASCKDTVWELMQTAKVTGPNSYQRRDSIDRPARRLTVVCASPVKPSTPKTPSGAKTTSFNPRQT